MADIKSFRGLRFNTSVAGDISTLTCKPYDVISDQDYENYININPYNIVRLELPRGDYRYEEASNLLRDWKIRDVLKRDPEDCIYIYEQEYVYGNKVRKIKGFISLVKLEDFSKGIILPHEHTLSEPKADRFNLLKSTRCNFSPIYSLYEDHNFDTKNLLDDLSSYAANVEMTDSDKTIHRLWIITNKVAINKLVLQFRERRLYIADGHHRYETALRYRDYQNMNNVFSHDESADYVMMMLVPMESEGLLVLPTHRLIKDIENFDIDEILTKLKRNFIVEKIEDISAIESKLDDMYSKNKKSFVFYVSKDLCFILALKDDVKLNKLIKDKDESVAGLDVTILDRLILNEILNIDLGRPEHQDNMIYTHEIDKAIRLVDGEKCKCAFIVNKTPVDKIREVSSCGCEMPHKSTYFYPKIITGLVMNELD